VRGGNSRSIHPGAANAPVAPDSSGDTLESIAAFAVETPSVPRRNCRDALRPPHSCDERSPAHHRDIKRFPARLSRGVRRRRAARAAGLYEAISEGRPAMGGGGSPRNWCAARHHQAHTLVRLLPGGPCRPSTLLGRGMRPATPGAESRTITTPAPPRRLSSR